MTPPGARDRTTLLQAWSEECAAARSARDRRDVAEEWRHLERAHILSQPMAGPHVRTHLAMLLAALRTRNPREIVGQAARVVMAAPGSLTGRFPVGNTGGADVSAFRPMPIPDDLRRFLGDDVSDGEAESFSTDTSGLPEAERPPLVELNDGDTFALHIAPVAKRIGDDTVRMLAYNGTIPGPTLRVPQGSEITVHVRNDADVEGTVHWHGLRLDNASDGVPGETQAPIPVGGEFTCAVRFPDEGLYWYHPHMREDYAQEMGLYGNILVVPGEPDAWAAVNREVFLTLDDVLIEDGRMAPFRRSGPTHTAMGRFGNVLLVGGDTSFELEASAGDVLRFYLTNTANTRLFNVRVPGARMKLVGGDSGRYERETFVEEVLLAPSERAIVDVLFDTPGTVTVEHRTPDRTYVLGTVEVSEVPAQPSLRNDFEVLRTNPELVAERERLDREIGRAPDKTLAFVSVMPLLYGTDDQDAAAWTCPMHPNVLASEPGTCPSCGMKLIPATAGSAEHAHDSDHEHTHAHDTADGLEWEDLMPEINRASDPTNMIWKLVDAETGRENADIDWSFRVGDRAKIRLLNEMDQDHPMHHPFHIHGAGRFLVLARNGESEPNLVWKDTALVRAGETVDILLDVTNPGLWMAHCHIAEHTESGMMFSFAVSET